MNYKNIYDKLIHRSVNRILPNGTYTEGHHIMPTCMGGTDDKNNIAILLAREHCLAHLLLAKIHPENRKLIYAAHLMYMGYMHSCRRYQWVREKCSEIMKNKIVSKETRKKISDSLKGPKHPHFGKKYSDEYKQNMSRKTKGIRKSEEWKRKMRGRKCSKSHCENVSKALKGHLITNETKLKISKTLKGHKLSAQTCKKISESRIGAKNHMFGKHHSQKTKEKLSLANKGKKWTEDARRKLSEIRKLSFFKKLILKIKIVRIPKLIVRNGGVKIPEKKEAGYLEGVQVG